MIEEQATDTTQAADTQPRHSFWQALLARRGTIAYLPIIVVVILMFCGASWQIFWLHTDAARYQCYGLTFWLGSSGAQLLPGVQCNFLHPATATIPAHPPFHMLPLEYPPLTIILFSLALFTPLLYYQLTFALLMALVAVLTYWLLLRYAPRGAGLAFALYMLVGAWATAEGRFDLVPAVLTLLCIIATERRHWTTAYIALAFGFLLKIYPLLFLPALFIAEQRDAQRFYTPAQPFSLQTLPAELWQMLKGIGSWRWKNAGVFLATILVVTGLFALLDFQGAVVSQLSYFASRPVQVESTGSTFLWLATLFGHPVQIVYTFGSINMLSDLGNPVALLFDVLLVAGYLASLLLQWRGKLDVAQAFIAILLVFITTGKVFSPQYLMWLIPLLAYSGAFNMLWLILWCAISALTTTIYPYFYTRTTNGLLAPYLPGFIEAVTLRNALFVFVTLAYLCNWFDLRARKPLPPPLTGKETQPLTFFQK